MSNPSVFISYSHKDEEWKDRLVTHLGVLERDGILNIWSDRRIQAGDDWYQEIEKAIATASIAILIISADFLTSQFILNEEIPRLLERNAKVGLRIIPIILRPCAWLEIKWLARFMARPKDGQPLTTINHGDVETELSVITTEINQLLRRAGVRPSTKAFVPLPPDKISLAKLPSTHSDLFGRQKELDMLDEVWDNPKINILPLVAWGGVGKTALVNKWLSHMSMDNYRGAERVFGWSFYSQGAAEGRQVSADQFIAAALDWFGDPDVTKGSPWDKGERLAELIKQQRTLLILDGLEPLQNPPPIETGRIKDPGLTSFLRELARQNPGLVVISTRLAVDDLKDFIGSTAIEIDLESLSDEAGSQYLAHLGVDGSDEERKEASHDFGGHALALTLMGSYLKVVHHGDIRKRREIPHLVDEQKQGAHARRVMESYEAFLKDKPELDILRLMGLFDRPAEKGALDALRKEPAIEGLTDALQKLGNAQWQFAVANLRDLRLLAAPDAIDPNELDCHPLLREHFGEQLKEGNPAAWREGNNRLYEYYKTISKELPETIQEMAPLFAAVIHGCQAGRYEEAYDVYWVQIQRKQKFFNFRKLGAFSADLAALSNFFEDMSWRKPVDGLREHIKIFVLGYVGYNLRALGRLVEATQSIQVCFDAYASNESWADTVRSAKDLSQLYLTIGNMKQALAYARKSIVFADKSDEEEVKVVSGAQLANVLHQSGDIQEASTLFHTAEKLQRQLLPQFPFLVLYLAGYYYCDLLLDEEKYGDVQHRSTQTLILSQHSGDLLIIALDNLFLGRAHLLQSQREPDHSFTESLTYLTRAVDGLRQAGPNDELPRGLLARAEYYRVTGDLRKSQNDLDEAFSITTRGGMGLYLADCHLEYARLYLAKGDKAKAREHWQIAKDSINKMGYHRRDKEVQELEEQLK